MTGDSAMYSYNSARLCSINRPHHFSYRRELRTVPIFTASFNQHPATVEHNLALPCLRSLLRPMFVEVALGFEAEGTVNQGCYVEASYPPNHNKGMHQAKFDNLENVHRQLD